MNFEYLTNKIIDAGEVDFRKIRADFEGHRFYFFGLFTSGEYSYLYPTCSSCEGLVQLHSCTDELVIQYSHKNIGRE